MKRMRRLIQMSVFTFAVSFAGISHAGSIVNTVHNMSTTGPGTIKASATQPAAVQGAEQEICVFCHTPHRANPAGKPLWNHDMPATTYTMYNSDYLTRIGYSPAVYNPTTAQPGMMSLVCLGCHDGTVAVGGIYAYKGSVLGATLVAMTQSGVPITTMPAGATNIGTNLQTHHPVGIQYDSTRTYAFGTGVRTIELASASSLSATPILLWNNQVECSSCHDPHIQNTKFLRVTTGATFADKIAATCESCHTKNGWLGGPNQTISVHQSQGTYNYADSNVAIKFGTGSMTTLACMNCHQDHAGLANMYLLRQQWSKTCFQGAGANATECHATALRGESVALSTVFTRSMRHYIVSDGVTVSKHTDLDVLNPTAVGKGLDWADSRHAECVDCHNPHRATNTPVRVLPTAWYPATVNATSNLTSNSGFLTGVTGVEPNPWPAIWAVPTTFSTQESSSKEYQICFKCHSYYALQTASGISIYHTTGLDNATITDQSMEFNYNNKSAHPVAVPLASQAGSYAPKPLTAAQMSAPWTAVGAQTMYCSDCHGADNEASGDPKGPHGSSYKYMLKGTNKYWPTNASGVLYIIKNGTTNPAADLAGLFCLNCHPMYSGTAYINRPHSEHTQQGVSPPCVACHIAVPHGSKRSRLIGYASDVAPYNYNPTGTYTTGKLLLSGFKKATTPTNYQGTNCYSTDNNCNYHSFNAGGYD